MANLNTRIAKLEAMTADKTDRSMVLVLIRRGESQEAALARTKREQRLRADDLRGGVLYVGFLAAGAQG